MTDNRRLKKAVRARMAETGENYTTALRKIKEQLSAAIQRKVLEELAANGEGIETRLPGSN